MYPQWYESFSFILSIHSFIYSHIHSRPALCCFFCWFHPYPQHAHDEYTLPLLLLLPHCSCSLLLKVHSHKKLTLTLTQNCENHTHYHHLVCLFVMLLHVVIVVGKGWGAPTAWVMYLLLSWVHKTNIFTLGEWRKTSVLVIANEFGMGFSR